jgi:8-oxo-dGTP diphosphatase
MAGDWEFPGGKVDAGESNEQALKRELHEELGIEVDVGELIGSVEHQYPSMTVKLSFYSCKTEASDFSMRVHDEIRWVDEDEANQLNWLPADVEFVAKLVDDGFTKL